MTVSRWRLLVVYHLGLLRVIAEKASLNDLQAQVVQALSNGSPESRAQLQDATKISRDTLIRVLNQLIEQQVVEKVGQGRATRYQLLREV